MPHKVRIEAGHDRKCPGAADGHCSCLVHWPKGLTLHPHMARHWQSWRPSTKPSALWLSLLMLFPVRNRSVSFVKPVLHLLSSSTKSEGWWCRPNIRRVIMKSLKRLVVFAWIIVMELHLFIYFSDDVWKMFGSFMSYGVTDHVVWELPCWSCFVERVSISFSLHLFD